MFDNKKLRNENRHNSHNPVHNVGVQSRLVRLHNCWGVGSSGSITISFEDLGLGNVVVWAKHY